MLYQDFFDKAVADFPNNVAVVQDERSWSYRELGEIVDQIAASLVQNGLQAGERVAIYSPNDAMGYACQYGALKAGGVWLPVNFRNGVEVTAPALADTKANWLFIHSSLISQVEAIKAQATSLKQIICLDKAIDGYPSLEDWIAGVDTGVEFPRMVSEEECAVLLSSGTTGKPKGISIAHRAFSSMIASFGVVYPIEKTPVHLVVAPITHAAGIYASTLLLGGAKQVLLNEFTPDAILSAIQQHKVTHLFLPPTIIYALLAYEDLAKYDVSSLVALIYGSAPMSHAKALLAHETFGHALAQGYGQSEALMIVTAFSPKDHAEAAENEELRHRLKSVGREGPFVQTKIMSDDGRLLGDDEVGEIVVRGDIVMRGYLNNPEADAEAKEFGWHHTGDLGYRDKDGFFYIVDRKRELIISGGFNLFPSEIEQAIMTHPTVKNCAVVGIPHEKWGEAVHAAVQLNSVNGTVTDEELIAHCKEAIGAMRAPKTIEFVDELPLSPVGKVLRRKVREPFWANQGRKV